MKPRSHPHRSTRLRKLTATALLLAVVQVLPWLSGSATAAPAPPTVLSLAPSADAFVYSLNTTTNYSTGTNVEVGSFTGAQKSRGLLKFDTPALTGKHILSATLKLWNYSTNQCGNTGTGVQVRRIATAWTPATVTWATQPTTTTTDATLTTDAYGLGDCPDNWMVFDTTAIAQAWADGQPNNGVALQGAVENDPTSFRKFNSSETTTKPVLQITYNTPPGSPRNSSWTPSRQAANGDYFSNLTPTLSIGGQDTDGGDLRHDFELSQPDGTLLWTASSAYLPLAQNGTVTIPAGILADQMTWRWRARQYDGTDYGPWTAYYEQTADGALPAAPGIGCADHPTGTWTPSPTAGFTCTLDAGSATGQSYRWSLDNPTPTTIVATTTGAAQNITIQPATGWHTLYALTDDGLGNLSPVTSYPFGTSIFGADFSGPDGLITNEYAHWNPDTPGIITSPDWEITSGSLFRRNNVGWSGTPDDTVPDATSSNGNNSNIFRAHTKRNDFTDIQIDLKVRNLGLHPGTTATDGLHVWLRHQNEAELYVASLNRRDNKIVIKKKLPGGPDPITGGTYYQLAETPYTWTPNTWQNLSITITGNGSSVTINVAKDGTQLLSATDDGTQGGTTISNPGAVGFRGDNCEFEIADFQVHQINN